MFSEALNTINFVQRRGALSLICSKVLKRFEPSFKYISKSDYFAWLKDNAISQEEFGRQLDQKTWLLSVSEFHEQAKKAESTASEAGVDLGGGGASLLLYFLVRKFKPKNVVETGVAAGHSSLAFLSAIQMNKAGRLYSSDLPYFRLPDPEALVGYVVKDELKTNWSLHLEGDKENLEKICSEVTSIDLFHYDSDKSVSGRQAAINKIESLLHVDSQLIFDDIQDNDHFYRIARSNLAANRRTVIIAYQNKFIGLLF